MGDDGSDDSVVVSDVSLISVSLQMSSIVAEVCELKRLCKGRRFLCDNEAVVLRLVGLMFHRVGRLS